MAKSNGSKTPMKHKPLVKRGGAPFIGNSRRYGKLRTLRAAQRASQI